MNEGQFYRDSRIVCSGDWWINASGWVIESWKGQLRPLSLSAQTRTEPNRSAPAYREKRGKTIAERISKIAITIITSITEILDKIRMFVSRLTCEHGECQTLAVP